MKKTDERKVPDPLHRRRAPSRQGMTVTAVALPDGMHRKLRVRAARVGTAVTELVRLAVAAYLDRPASRRHSA